MKKKLGRYNRVVQKKLNKFIKLSLTLILLPQSRNHAKPDKELKKQLEIKYRNPR